MQKTILTVISTAFLCFSNAGLGQAPAGPSAAEGKLKEMVKSLTQRVTSAEQEKAALLVEKAASEAKIKDMTESIKKMTDNLKEKIDDMTKLREESGAKEAMLNTELNQKKTDLEATAKSLEKWKAAHVEISEIARKKEAERAKQAAIASATTRRVEDLRMRNDALYKTGNDILDRLKKFGLGEVIAAREPFTGNMRIKLKNQVQEFSDALLDGTADSKRPWPVEPKPAAAAAAAPATSPDATKPAVSPPASPEAKPAATPEKAPEAKPEKST